MPRSRPTGGSILAQRPTRWAIAVGAILLAYSLLQPQLEQQFGAKLPSLGTAQPAGTVQTPDARSFDAPVAPGIDGATDGNTTPELAAEGWLATGILTEVAADDYLSAAGLRYARGSQEGHRLKHLERHLRDDPQRPGRHGVFFGDLGQALRWIDDVYIRGRSGAEGTLQRDEGERTVYEASFPQPVGYIGGRDGKRSQNPEARRIRLVTDGNRFITAFPF
ncbi:MAG: hypothetical protein KDA45_10805 [Planctomycetales bacterium]|nr:hypothetical protein [Planctomycetales bacterium]